MRIAATSLAILSLAFFTPAVASEPAPKEAKSAQEQKKSAEPKKICRRIQSMGSRRTERVCMTQKEWEDFNNGN